MVCGIVLSGGMSRRFQVPGEPWRDKALYELDGRPMISFALEKLKGLASEVIVAAGSPGRAELYTRALGVTAVADDDLMRGPLSGLYASLRLCDHDLFIALPNDMPLLEVSYLGELLALARHYDTVSPIFPNGLVETAVIAGRVDTALWVLGLLRGMKRGRVADLHRGVPRLYLSNPVGRVRPQSFLNVNSRESLGEKVEYPEGPLRGDVKIEREFGEGEAREGRARATLWTTLFRGEYLQEFSLYASSGVYMFAGYVLQDSPHEYERELGRIVVRSLKPSL
ncbi:MAG: NTP transferase domain-containing protein [Acidilobaceae archaeon]